MDLGGVREEEEVLSLFSVVASALKLRVKVDLV